MQERDRCVHAKTGAQFRPGFKTIASNKLLAERKAFEEQGDHGTFSPDRDIKENKAAKNKQTRLKLCRSLLAFEPNNTGVIQSNE